MEQTAVEWLCEQYHLKQDIEIVEQAKEMEKQQIENAYIECKREYIIRMDCYPPQFVVDEAKQYYNKTFKNTEQ